MADQKDRDPNLPADPTFLPLKKRAMAEKSLPGFIRAPESNSDSSGSSDDEDAVEVSDEDSVEDFDEDEVGVFDEESKKRKIEELQRKAYYSVLNAFKLKSSTISHNGNLIIERLMNEWNISEETYISVADKIEKDLLAPQDFTCASDAKEMQIVEEKPLIYSQEKKEYLSPTSVPKSGSSWGYFNPETLVGKWVSVRLQDRFEEFIIKEYDPKLERHLLENEDSNAMELDENSSWMDIRQIPAKDIMWPGGEKPNFDAPNQSTARRAFF